MCKEIRVVVKYKISIRLEDEDYKYGKHQNSSKKYAFTLKLQKLERLKVYAQ